MIRRMTFPTPPTSARAPMQHPRYGVVWTDVPLVVGEFTPWHEFFYGFPLRLIGRENDGRTLVLEAVQPQVSSLPTTSAPEGARTG